MGPEKKVLVALALAGAVGVAVTLWHALQPLRQIASTLGGSLGQWIVF